MLVISQKGTRDFRISHSELIEHIGKGLSGPEVKTSLNQYIQEWWNISKCDKHSLI